MSRPPRELPAPRYGGEPRKPAVEEDTTETIVIDPVIEPDPVPTPVQGVPRLDWGQQLRREMRSHADGYLHALKQVNLKGERRKADLASRANDLKGKHKAYASMMVLSALVPLKDGVSMSAVAESLGMGVTMWLLSPNFRQQVGSFTRDARMAIEDMANARRKHQREQVNRDIQEHKEKHGGELPWSLKRRLERIEASERGDRLPFNEMSAALTHIGLSEAAFEQMRAPGADPAEVQENYDRLMERFWDDVQLDGLDVGRVSALSRMFVGQRMAYEPEWAYRFVETAHGEVDMDMTEQIDPRTGELGRTWSGKWSTRAGESVISGAFTVRPPQSDMQHEMSLSVTMAREMERAALNGNLVDLNETLMAYGSAWFVRDKALDTQAIPGQMGEKIRRAQRGLEAMEFDGFGRDLQRDVYSTSFVHAMELVAKAHPDIERHWAQQYGSQWRAEMRDFAASPEETYNRWQRGEYYSDPRESPGHDNAHADAHTERMRSDKERRRHAYNRARDNQEYNEHETSAFEAETDFELNDVDDGFEMGESDQFKREDGDEPSLG